MSNGEASLAARFATCPPVVRGVTGLRAGALDAGDFAGVATEAFAALPRFAAALLRALPEDPAFGGAGLAVGELDGLRVLARFAGTAFLPLSLSEAERFGLGADRFFSGIRTMLTLPPTKCQGADVASAFRRKCPLPVPT